MSLFRDAERLKDFAAACQSFAIAAGLIIGGAWTALVFYSRREAETSKVQYEKLQRELEGRAVLHFDLSASEMSISERQRVMVVIVKAENRGTRDVTVTFPEGHVAGMARVNWDKAGKLLLDPPTWGIVLNFRSEGQQQQLVRSVGLTVRAGNSSELTTAIPISEPGLYLVSFNAKYAPRELDEARTIATSSRDDLVYFYARNIYVAVR